MSDFSHFLVGILKELHSRFFLRIGGAGGPVLHGDWVDDADGGDISHCMIYEEDEDHLVFRLCFCSNPYMCFQLSLL